MKPVPIDLEFFPSFLSSFASLVLAYPALFCLAFTPLGIAASPKNCHPLPAHRLGGDKVTCARVPGRGLAAAPGKDLLRTGSAPLARPGIWPCCPRRGRAEFRRYACRGREKEPEPKGGRRSHSVQSRGISAAVLRAEFEGGLPSQRNKAEGKDVGHLYSFPLRTYILPFFKKNSSYLHVCKIIFCLEGKL